MAAATDPFRQVRRRRVVATTAVTTLLLALLALKVTSMQVATALGEQAWRSGDHAAAAKWFGVSERFNMVQRWVAPYNRGVAAHSAGEWRNAAIWYEQALEVAPDAAMCRIALNWTWALEAAGDELAGAGDEQTAALRWAEAKRVLAQAGGCDQGAASERPSSPTPDEQTPQPSDQPTTDDTDDADRNDKEQDASEGKSGRANGSQPGTADATRERLDKKLQLGEQEPERRPEQQDREDQAAQLAERNREGAREKQRNEDGREGKPDDGNGRTW